MQRLNISNILAAKNSITRLFGSAYRLPNGRRLGLQGEFSKIHLGDRAHGTSEFLDDCGLLFQ